MMALHPPVRQRGRWTVPEYLASTPVIHTRSLEEARDAVTRVYLPHRLEGYDDALDMRLNAITDRRLTLGYLTYHASTELHMPATEDSYHVNLNTVGQTWASRGDGALAHTTAGRGGTVLLPDEQTSVRWSGDAEQLILKVSRASLESHLADLLGRAVDDVVDFDFQIDLAAEPGRALLRAVAFLASELDRPKGMSTSPLARGQLESFVLTQLLLAGRHQFSDALRGEDDRARLGRLASVVAYIDEHAEDELSPQLLASIGCVSVRTLHASFQSKVGESPMAYVRRVRLGKVRADLLAANAEHTRVADVATRWGFYHQSRFAAQYRAQFDELPRATLNR
jgi:AraC-like DNA-binding protein